MLNNSLAASNSRDCDFNNCLAAANMKDCVFYSSLLRKIWLSPQKDLGSIIRNRRVPKLCLHLFNIFYPLLILVEWSLREKGVLYVMNHNV